MGTGNSIQMMSSSIGKSPDINISTSLIVCFISRVEEIAKKKGASMAQIALAWIMQKDGVTAPIVGTTSLENLNDLLGKLPFLPYFPPTTPVLILEILT